MSRLLLFMTPHQHASTQKGRNWMYLRVILVVSTVVLIVELLSLPLGLML
jgi:hypothetical protein